MKRLFTLLFCIFFPLFSFSQDNLVFVRNWMAMYIIDENQQLRISDSDYQALINLLAFSFSRSVQTIESQQIAYDSLQTTWKAWANICATRLNPSKEKPYNFEIKQVSKLKNLKVTIKQHESINNAYTQIINEIVKGDVLQTQHAKNAITAIRSQARQIVSDALLDVKQHVKFLTDQTKKNINRLIRSYPAVPAPSAKLRINSALYDDWELFDLSDEDKALAKAEGSHTLNLETTRFLETIWHSLTLFGIQSFVEADELSCKVSNDAWDVLMQVQQSSLYVWKTIEEARATFYQTTYNELRIIFPDVEVTCLIDDTLRLPTQLANW